MERSKEARQLRCKILTDDEVRALAKATKAFLGPEIMAISKSYDLSIEDSLRYMSLSARLEDSRTARGLTLKETAKELKVPKYRLEDVEKGAIKNLMPGLLVEYVAFLGLKAWLGKWKKANADLSARLGLAAGTGIQAGEKRASIPALVKTLADKKLTSFCGRRIPPHAAHQVRLSHTFRGNTATIFEHRAPWRAGDTEWSAMPIAQLRYDQKTEMWSSIARTGMINGTCIPNWIQRSASMTSSRRSTKTPRISSGGSE